MHKLHPTPFPSVLKPETYDSDTTAIRVAFRDYIEENWAKDDRQGDRQERPRH